MNEEQKTIQRQFCKLNTVRLHTIAFFNLWKYGEEMSYILFKIIQFIIRET